ncbi:MAG TPA: sigma factor-like helix-turn-helix DNA-binding protein [Thermoanaerobaculia bacterium]|nr:sigma factor-like helix-turn-helix DNA-binding protein [Thermoanaerobaculia bacterium]
MVEPLTFPWNTLLELQQLTDSATVNARSHAADEAFAVLLSEVAGGTAPLTPDALKQRFHTLTANRAKKHRARLAVEPKVLHHELDHRDTPNLDCMVAYRQLATLALATVPASDAEVLVAVLVEGLEYQEIAATVGKPIGTVKSQVSRARRRVRSCAFAVAIIEALRAA